MIIGAVGVLIPYTILTAIFEYPGILRWETGIILTKFHEGGNRLIFTWLAFALAGLPLLPAYILLGKSLENQSGFARVATKMGTTGLIVQMIGLLRWVFVVPVLSDSFVATSDPSLKTAAIMSFNTIHQFGGVLLGEHLGQLFTVIWTLIMSINFIKWKIFPQWIGIFGVVSAVIYFLAQAELLATVVRNMPVWEPAGFIGSTLWLIWMTFIGVSIIRTKNINP